MPIAPRTPVTPSGARYASNTSLVRGNSLRYLLSLCLMVWSAMVTAPTLAQDLALVDAVERFLLEQAPSDAQNVSVEVFPPSAQFGDCLSPRPFLRNGHQRQWGRVSVGVECAGSQDRYLQAEVNAIGTYVTAAERIEANTVIDQGMLTMREGNLDRLPSSTIRKSSEAVGMLARRTITAGSTLREHQLRTIPLVERRQTVSVEAQGTGFRVSREGEALEDGGLGEDVRIRLSRREIITGRVVGAGRVAIDF